MGTINVTAEDFQSTIEDSEIVFVDWWAAWCAPCRMFAPVYEKAAAEHQDIAFAKVDTEAEAKLAEAFQIMSIPTLMVFRERVLVFSQPGALPGAALEDLIAQVRALDMEQVHRAVAAGAAR